MGGRGDNTNPSTVLQSGIDAVAFLVLVVLIIGIISLLISRRTGVSYVPLLIILGMLVGPVAGIVDHDLAREMFSYVRVFGLFIILFAEGHHLWRSLLQKNITPITLLDTVGMLITALLAGFFFSIVFHVPWKVGFLFGAIISATDPATLIPLFKQHNVPKDMETIVVTESIFNDPLGIVLTSVALVFVFPEAPSAHIVEAIANYVTLYPAAVLYFLYQIAISLMLGGVIAYFGYLGIKKLKLRKSPYIEMLSLTLAFAGFLVGEIALASGFLVATVIGILLGNHDDFFGDTSLSTVEAVDQDMRFNDLLASFATVFVFVLLGASIDTSHASSTAILYGAVVGLLVVFVARPVATLVLVPRMGWKKTLFIALEGPRGVVPASMAGLPLALGMMYEDSQMIFWGELILASVLITVLLSVILETTWVGFLKKKLLDTETE